MQNLDLPRFRRLTKEGGWIVIGQIISVSGALVLVRVLTEYLDPTQYGQLALGLTVAGLVNQVVMGGIAAGIGRFFSIAAEKQDLPNYLSASRQLMLYATLAALVIGIALMVGMLWLGYLQWMGLAAAAWVFSVLGGYNSALSGIQNAARQRAVVAFHGGFDAWLKMLLVLCMLLWLGNSSTGVVIGYALSSLLIIVSQLYFLRRLIPNQRLPDVKSTQWMPQMWLYSWPMAAGGLFNWGYYASQRWALELFATTGQVGQFYALTQIAYSPISMAGGMCLSFLTPILFARAGDASDLNRLRNARRMVKQVATLGFGFTVTIAIISYFAHGLIFQLMVASKYREISVYMPYVILSAGILQVSLSIGTIVSFENKTRRILPLAIIGNLIISLMNLYFTRQWGISGLFASMIAGALIHLTWMIIIVSKNGRRCKKLE